MIFTKKSYSAEIICTSDNPVSEKHVIKSDINQL